MRTLGLILLLAHPALAQQAEPRFASEACQVAFSYPADWEVILDTTWTATPCHLQVRPRDWQQRLIANDSVDVYTIAVRVAARGVWDAVPESGFERRDTGWVILGRQGLEAPADTISGRGWRGLRGMATIGCYRETDAYVGLCEVPTALAGTQSRSVIIIASPRSEDVFDRILNTLQFP